MNATLAFRAARRHLAAAVLLAVAGLLVPPLATDAAAQSEAGTASATVEVLADAFSVTGLQDMEFGTHFASEGILLNEIPAGWLVQVSVAQFVDLAMTQLPATLDGPGGSVPLTYDVAVMAAVCGGVVAQADPAIGFDDCFIEPDINPNVLLDLVEVNLNGAAAGTYTGTLELTATLN